MLQSAMQLKKYCLILCKTMKLLPVGHDINANNLPEKWQKTMNDAIYGTDNRQAAEWGMLLWDCIKGLRRSSQSMEKKERIFLMQFAI